MNIYKFFFLRITGTLEEKKSAEVAAEKPSTTEVESAHPSCSKYGLGLCVRLMSSDEPTETVAELGAPERGISVTPTTHIDVSERASLSSYEMENLKLLASNDSIKVTRSFLVPNYFVPDIVTRQTIHVTLL